MTRSSVAEVEKKLAENAKQRNFRMQSHFQGAFGEYGIFTMMKLDESSPDKARRDRLLLMSNLLDLLDEGLLKNPLQKSVRLVDSEGEKTHSRDKFLKGLVAVVAGDALEKDEKDAVYKSFYYLIHNFYFDKKYQVPVSELVSRASEDILLYTGDVPAYPNAYATNGDLLVDEKALKKEMRNKLAQRVFVEREKLHMEFIALGGKEREWEAGKIIGRQVSVAALLEVASNARESDANTDEVKAMLVSLFEHRASGIPRIGPEIPAANPSAASINDSKLPRGSGRGAGA